MITKDDYTVGKFYHSSQIPEEDTEEYTVSQYGIEYIGQNAIHIRIHQSESDIWFILDACAVEYIYKCVYKN